MIERLEVNVAKCDACRRRVVSDDQGNFSEGFVLTILNEEAGTEHHCYACKEPHIGPAARKVLAEWREGAGN